MMMMFYYNDGDDDDAAADAFPAAADDDDDAGLLLIFAKLNLNSVTISFQSNFYISSIVIFAYCIGNPFL